MSPMWWVLVAFVAGYLWGKFDLVVLRLIFDREEPLMRRVRRILGHTTEVSTWAVVASLMFSSAIGIVVITQKRDDASRTNCSIRFNRLSALARDDRLNAQTAALNAQIDSVAQDLDYQLGLRHSLRNPHTTIDTLITVIDRKSATDRHLLRSLVHQRKVSAEHVYPPPNYCESS